MTKALKYQGVFATGQLIENQCALPDPRAAWLSIERGQTPPGGAPARCSVPPLCDPIHDFGQTGGGK